MGANEFNKNRIIGMIRFNEFSSIYKDLAAMPYALIKGEALSVLMYGEEAKRVSSDIDVLVKREDISRFEEILVHNGYETMHSNHNRYNRVLCLTGSHQIGCYLKKVMGIDVIVDINFDIFWGEYRGKRIEVETLLNNVIEIQVYGKKVKTLSPCFACIQLVLHHYKEFNSIYHLVKGNAVTSKKLKDINDFLKCYCKDESFLKELIYIVHFYEIEPYFYYMLFYVREIFFGAVYLDRLIDEFECNLGIWYLDKFGLSDLERKTWNICFSERIDSTALSGLVRQRLTLEDEKKLNKELEIFG